VALTDLMRLSLRERRTRNLVQCRAAGNPGRDDKGKGNGSIESGCWTEAFFIALGGPQGHDNSVEKHLQEGGVNTEISPLRFAPVEMTRCG
jgi:hypothetical protein